jgi:hypothetical protein
MQETITKRETSPFIDEIKKTVPLFERKSLRFIGKTLPRPKQKR